jgi:hypothetical protein
MAFVTLTAKVRKNPFAFSLLNQLFANQRDNEALQNVEHDRAGRHNGLEVARAVGTAYWNGVSYALEGHSSIISSLNRVSAGVVEVNLNSSYFQTKMVPRVSVMDNGTESVPYIAHVAVNSASKVTVYIHALAALAGNTWAATDGTFAIALHAMPYDPVGSFVTAITDATRGNTLGGNTINTDVRKWNTFVQNQANLRSRMMAEHTSAGAHNAREVAKGAGVFSWDGAAYDSIDVQNVTSCAPISTGRARVTIPAGYTTPYQVFAQADYRRQIDTSWADLTVVNVPRSQHTATTFDVFMYRYDDSVNQWARQYFDFACSIHTAPT